MPVFAKRLFVYGTLLRGETALRGWQKRAGATLIGRARARGVLYDLGRYPGAIFDPTAAGQVHGELYELKRPSGLAMLDAYEEIDPLNRKRRAFARERITVETADGRTEEVWGYAYRGAVGNRRVIAGGNWPEYRRNRAGPR